MFHGRIRELSRLREEFAAHRPSLLALYGRRRVGKSALLREAVKGLPHVFHQATRVTAALNLEALKAEIARALGADDVLASLDDWLGVLTWLVRRAESVPGLVVVLDEFPCLVDVDPAIPSIIQKFWDSAAAATSRLNLVLCGSSIADMEELLAGRNPLYGRKTLAMHLAPLPLRDATAFFPRQAAEDRLRAYGIFGGIPFYLTLYDPDLSLQHNVVNLLLSDSGPLFDEATVLLQSELRDIQRYASIPAAIADGCTRLGEISGRVGDIGDATRLAPCMERLHRMRLVRPVASMDAEPTSRDRRYFISDPLIRFWHRFVRPNMSSVVEGFGKTVWRLQIAPTSTRSWALPSKTSAASTPAGTRRNFCRLRLRKSARSGTRTMTSTSPDDCSTAPWSTGSASGAAAPWAKTCSRPWCAAPIAPRMAATPPGAASSSSMRAVRSRQTSATGPRRIPPSCSTPRRPCWRCEVGPAPPLDALLGSVDRGDHRRSRRPQGFSIIEQNNK